MSPCADLGLGDPAENVSNKGPALDHQGASVLRPPEPAVGDWAGGGTALGWAVTPRKGARETTLPPAAPSFLSFPLSASPLPSGAGS